MSVMRGRVTAVDSRGVYVRCAEIGPTSVGPCQVMSGVSVAEGDPVLVADVGSPSAPDLVVLGEVT